ncbi:MAG: HAD-IB family hydrolase [Acidimicrobiia bacterium]
MSPAESTPRRVAAFDFDGTIARRDTVIPFLAAVAGRTAVLRTAARRAPQLARIAAGLAPGEHHDATKEYFLRRLLAGRTAEELAAAGEAYAGRLWARQRFRPDMLERLSWHRTRGHDIVIVSASLEAYLSPLAPRLGVGHVIGCTFVSDERGVLTGELAGGNVRGPEKARRLRHWLGGEEARAGVELWAYGDSSGDDELLAMADHATRVGSRDR